MQSLSPGLDALAKQLLDASLQVEIADPEAIDVDAVAMGSLVARSANAFGRAARLSGMARAEAKRAKYRYEYTLKSNRSGKNEAEREVNSRLAAEAEMHYLMDAEEVAAVAEGIENAARVASESARKLLDKIESMSIAEGRQARGAFVDSDFTPY